MTFIRRFTPLVFLSLLCWLVLLTAVSDPVCADDSTGKSGPVITKIWQPDACNDFVFTFNLKYTTEGKLDGITFTVKPSYTGVSPEFTIPAVVDAPHPFKWEVKAEKDWKTTVSQELVKIVQGTINLHRTSGASGGGNMLLTAGLKYYCNPQFFISNEYAFNGTLFLFDATH